MTDTILIDFVLIDDAQGGFAPVAPHPATELRSVHAAPNLQRPSHRPTP